MNTSKISFLAVSIGLAILCIACNDQANVSKPSAPEVVSGKISPPAHQAQTGPAELNTEMPAQAIPEANSEDQTEVPSLIDQKPEYYEADGKIDPFLPLIQEKIEEPQPAAADDSLQRILTPLEKIELSQIRLVAVIIMEKKRIAMVEEATGKGYEITMGTFIGRNQGKVTEIKDSSIVVTELVKDFKGKLKEQTQEIKLHKNDDEE
jgi:type IV pilus assembly protein PilP